MKKRLAVAAFALAGCASSVVHYVPIHTSERPAFLIECRRGLVECYRKANALCPGGYDVNGTGSAGSESSGSVVPVGNATIVSTSTRQGADLAVTCKGPAAPDSEAAAGGEACTDSNDCALGYECDHGYCKSESAGHK